MHSDGPNASCDKCCRVVGTWVENLVVEMIVQWQFMHPIPNLVEQLPLEPLIHLFEKQPIIVWYQ